MIYYWAYHTSALVSVKLNNFKLKNPFAKSNYTTPALQSYSNYVCRDMTAYK